MQNCGVRSFVVYEPLEFVFKTIFTDNADATGTANKGVCLFACFILFSNSFPISITLLEKC